MKIGNIYYSKFLMIQVINTIEGEEERMHMALFCYVVEHQIIWHQLLSQPLRNICLFIPKQYSWQ
jgi:hypothetical protein